MGASVPEIETVAVTVLEVATFLSAKVPAVETQVTVSPATAPVRERVTVAAVVAS